MVGQGKGVPKVPYRSPGQKLGVAGHHAGSNARHEAAKAASVNCMAWRSKRNGPASSCTIPDSVTAAKDKHIEGSFIHIIAHAG